MPSYEYLCPSCGSRFEAWQKITEDPIETCPTCGGSVHRVVFPVGLMFKGSGFYSTDNRHSSAAAVPSAPTNGSSGDSSKASGGSPSESGSASTTASKTPSTPSTPSGE